MDRRGQLSNVAFGGEWSEAIAPQEAMLLALEILERAVDRTPNEDLRLDAAVQDALQRATDRHPKGDLLRQAWLRALTIPNPGVREQEVRRVRVAIQAWADGAG